MPLAISPVDATFWLAVMVLIAAFVLAIIGATKESEGSKHLFAIVGVMLGLFGAGGLGSLFAKQAANEAAEKAAPEAATAAVQAAEEQTEEPEKSHKGSSKKNGKAKTGP